MTEIKKIYRQSLPDMKFVGKCYGESDKKNGTFSDKWCEWFENNLFEPLKVEGEEPFEDSNAYIGLCACRKDGSFDYLIGVFMPAGAAVPEGYIGIDFKASDIAVCYVYGKEPDIYFADPIGKMTEAGFNRKADSDGTSWCFERYVCPRFTVPDDNGNVILDMCFFTDTVNPPLTAKN